MVTIASRAHEVLRRVRRRHPSVDIVAATLAKFRADQASKLAALIAYYGFFSLFPLLLVFVTVSSWILAGHPDWQERLVDSAVGQFPVIGDQIRNNLGELHGSGLAFAFGLVVALWGGLAATQSIQDALSVMWGVPADHQAGFVRSRLRSLVVLLAIAAGVVLTTALTGVANMLDSVAGLAQVAVVAGSFLVALVLFVVVFRVLAPLDLSVRAVLPGAAVGAVGWVALQTIGAALLNHQLREASALYGVFGLVIGLLSWLYLLAQVATISAELNVVLRDRRVAAASLRESGAKVEKRLAQDA